MATRYTQLKMRSRIWRRHLNSRWPIWTIFFRNLTGGGSAAGYGNDELALEFGDIFCAVGHMLEHGEILQSEIDTVQPLSDMLELFQKEASKEFWRREALFSNSRWEQLRICAASTLLKLPDEERDSDYLRGLRQR